MMLAAQSGYCMEGIPKPINEETSGPNPLSSVISLSSQKLPRHVNRTLYDFRLRWSSMVRLGLQLIVGSQTHRTGRLL